MPPPRHAHRASLLGAALLTAACTRAGFAPPSPLEPFSGDGRADAPPSADSAAYDQRTIEDAHAPDDAPPGRLCPGSWTAFSAPAPLLDRDGKVIKGQAAEVSADGLELYVVRFVAPVFTLLVARRARTADPFATPIPVPGLDPTVEAHSPAIAAGGTLLFFRSVRADGVGQEDLWVAERPAGDDSFGLPVNLAAINTAFDESSPWSLDGLILYFRSNRPGGSGKDEIYVATRSRLEDPFGNIVNLQTINSPEDDGGPALSSDGLELLFDSDRPGGRGAEDIWCATRSDRAAPFGEPRNVAELNSASDDSDPSLSTDGTTLYLSHDWAANGAEVWVATRECR